MLSSLYAMLRIDRENRALEPTLTQTLIEAGLKERGDLQELIERNSKAFFDEIGLENAVLLGTEIKPASDMVGDRIDVLAADQDGTIIVIELKRGGNKLLLLQGISYAAMIAKWQPDQFCERLREDRYRELQQSLDEGARINGAQRIVLVADAFEYEVLTTAEWLLEKYDLDILCIRLQVAKDLGSGVEYLTCEQVYPPLEIEDQVRIRKRGESLPSSSSAEILKATTNADVSAFLEEQRTKVTFVAKDNSLKYVVGSRIEWSVTIRKQHASVYQYRRFSGDLEFWEERLSKPEKVDEKDTGRALAFHLQSKEDFDRFLDAWTKAATFEWQSRTRGR
jgi:hypothetical protein